MNTITIHAKFNAPQDFIWEFLQEEGGGGGGGGGSSAKKLCTVYMLQVAILVQVELVALSMLWKASQPSSSTCESGQH